MIATLRGSSARKYALWLAAVSLAAFIGFTVTILSTVLALTVVVAIVGTFLAFHYRATALELSILGAAVSYHVSVETTPINLSAAILVLPFLVISAYKSVQTVPRSASKLRLVTTYSFVMLVLFMLSLTYSSLSGNPVSVFAGANAIYKMIIGFLFLGAGTLAASASLRRRDFRFLVVWSVSAQCIAIATLFSMATPFKIVPSDSFGRYEGTLGDPNLFATYLLLSAMVAGVVNILRKGRPWGINMALLLLAVLSTGSRGVLVTAAMLIVAYVLFASSVGDRFKVVFGIVVVSSVAALLTHQLMASIPAVGRAVRDFGGLETDTRVALWTDALDLWRHSPLFGIGPGQFQHYTSGVLGSEGGVVTHNTFIGFLTETGLVGLFAFLTIFVAALRTVLRSLRDEPMIRLWLFLGFISVQIQMMSLNLENTVFIWLFVAVLLSSASFSRAVPIGVYDPESGKSLAA